MDVRMKISLRTPTRPAWPRPDFLAPRTVVSARVWLVGAASVAVLLTAALEFMSLRDQTAGETERLALWERASSTSQRTAAVQQRQRGGNAADTAPLRLAHQWSQHLRHRWPEVFEAVESSTRGGVQWLSLAHDSEQPDVRLEGLSPDAATALAMVDTLATRPGWSGVVLTRLSVPEGTTGISGLRFEIAARLEPR